MRSCGSNKIKQGRITMKILHTADFHIDAVQSGKWDPDTGLPIRVMDFLKSMDTIIDTAINEKVDLFLFSGDAFKDRHPKIQYQTAWAERILRLEDAQIPTYLLVGNHDAGANMKAHALTEFKTFKTKYIHVVDKIELIKTEAFDIVSLCWVHKSKLIMGEVIQQLEELIEKMDPETANLFLGHCSTTNAQYSTGQMVTLGDDLMIPLKLLTESGFDYCALGHIHKYQNLSESPPVIYPGSVEHVDWGEAEEDKGFIIAEVNKDSCDWGFHKLDTRPMIDVTVNLQDKEDFYTEIYQATDEVDDGKDAPGVMIRIKLQYPENWAGLINNQQIEAMFPDAFSVQIVQSPIREGRTRLDLEEDIASYSPKELLKMYFEEKGTKEEEIDELLELSKTVLEGA